MSIYWLQSYAVEPLMCILFKTPTPTFGDLIKMRQVSNKVKVEECSGCVLQHVKSNDNIFD